MAIPAVRRYFKWVVALALSLAALQPSDSLAILNIFDMKSVLGSQTKVERKLSKIATDIGEYAGDARRERADKKVDALYLSGLKIWATSPLNKPGVIAPGKPSAYEAGILLQAMVSYAEATGRPARAIPILLDAKSETKKLRIYNEWQSVCLALIDIYHRLGMRDQEEALYQELFTFYRRLKVLERLEKSGADRGTIKFFTLFAENLNRTSGTAQTPAEVRSTYAQFQRLTIAAAEHWNWQPETGFLFVRTAPAFLRWFARHGTEDEFASAVASYRELMAWNRATDPLLLAGERDINFMMSALGSSIFETFAIRTGKGLDWQEGVFTWDDTRPEQIRFLQTSALDEALTLAEASVIAGHYEKALAYAAEAEKALVEVEAFYRTIDDKYTGEDGLQRKANRLSLFRGQALEQLGQCEAASQHFRQFIAWSENARASMSIDERLNFFRGTALPAYLGAIRCAARRFEFDGSDQSLSALLVATEAVRGRQFEESLGLANEFSMPAAPEMLARLTHGQGILLFQDLDTHFLSLVIGNGKADAQLLAKPPGWDQQVFALRNALAEQQDYNDEKFGALGEQLVGFAAETLSGLQHFLVLTDGALSSLPPSIIPLGQDQPMMGENASMTLLPSLSVWLQGKESTGEQSADKLLVLADPQYQSSERVKELGKTMLALRGSTALGYFEALPETRQEAESIIRSFGGESQLYAGSAALESAVKATELSSFSHLHFATHGVIGNDLPGIREPALVLGYEEDEDGLLTASEVAGLKLNAKLAVLSACNTGNGEYFSGEGLLGMGRAFMLAGARRVLVSLWPVDSFSTQRLMELLYANMRAGLSVEAALSSAQESLRTGYRGKAGVSRGVELGTSVETSASEAATAGEDYANPFYWSPFVLISSQ